ncbi:TPA: hypothetical protein DEB00_02870 [Candidatus Uhrbacteria bacterium]|nr:hypothetical protein [Candidatus Uhrbacteria bacterium]
MSYVRLALTNILTPFAIAALLFGGTVAVSMAAPALVDQAQAASTITADDLLSDEFTGATGLGQANLKSTIGNIINVLLGFLGIVAVLIILYGGAIWMTAGGTETKVQKAQQIIVAGAIGLAIILSAYAITNFVITEFINATADSITE